MVALSTALIMTIADLQELSARVALNEDAEAYKKLFLHYHPKLLSFSQAITHCKESSEEVVSDVFLKIWKRRATLLQIKNLPLYLYVSTRNISLNYLARQKNAPLCYLDEANVELTSIYYNPEQMMITAEMFHRIRTAVDQLPPRCRLIFKLVKEGGLAYKEVAELLQLSLKTVENQMTIALKKLGESVSLQKTFFLS